MQAASSVQHRTFGCQISMVGSQRSTLHVSCTSSDLIYGTRRATDNSRNSAVVGAILQTAAINIEMLFIGRVIGTVHLLVLFLV